MSGIRVARVCEEIRHQISEILTLHLSDPRLSWISVTRVEMSPDLRHARVYLSVLGSEKDQEISLQALHRARGAIRAELAKRLRARRVPELDYIADRSIAYSIRIQQILRELGFAGGEAGAADAEEGG